jgi:hypothetical protein
MMIKNEWQRQELHPEFNNLDSRFIKVRNGPPNHWQKCSLDLLGKGAPSYVN